MSARIWLYLSILLALIPLDQGNGGIRPRSPITADNAAQVQQVAVIGHGHLNDVAWSPDARSIAIASDLGLWFFDSDLTGGYLFDGVADSIVVLDFNQDGTILAAGDESGNVYFFDAIHASLINKVSLGNGPIGDLALQTDGTRFGVTSHSNTALLDRHTLDGYELHDELVSSISISAAGNLIAFPVFGGFGAEGDIVELYDTRTGLQVTAWEPGFHVTRLAFNPTGDRLLVAAADGEISLWSMPEAVQVLSILASSASLMDAAWSPDGTRVAATTTNPFGTEGNDVLIFDSTTGDEVVQLAANTTATAITFSPDGLRLVAVTAGDTIQLWDSRSGDELGHLANPWCGNALDFSPDGTTLAVACGHLRFYDTTDWAQDPLQLGRQHETISVLSYLPDGRIVTGSHVGSGGALGIPSPIRLWDLDTGQSTVITEYDPSLVSTLVVSLDGTHIASTGSETRITPIGGGQELVIAEHGELQVLAFSPDGMMLASGSSTGLVQLWDCSGRLVQTLTEYAGGDWNPVNALAFSGDGAVLVSASYRRLRVHDVASSLERWSRNHLTAITSLTISLDGSLLVVADEDGDLYFYNLANGLLLAERSDSFKPIEELAFSPDGTLLVGISDDGSLRVWACTEPSN